MKFYIAGPMTGLPDFNYPEFNKAADELRKQGYKVVNPAELDGGDTSMTWTYYIKRDLKELLDCQGIVLLKGWEKSKGANIEVFVAKALGYMIYIQTESGYKQVNSEQLKSDSVLTEAHDLVHGNRQEDYGHPYHDFSRTAKIWSAILGMDVTPQQVALCMVGVKISRECNKPKRDNRVDIAGYAETLDMVVNFKE